VLDELFNVLLHKLMTGKIRVADLDLSALSDGRAGVRDVAV
jgi:type I restriction enzyme S subunit